MNAVAVFRCTVSLLLVAATLPAYAGENLFEERLSFDLGTYFMSSDTTVRVDELKGEEVGSTIPLEDSFGFEDEKVFRLEAGWRFAQRHKLSLMYFDSKRTRTAHLNEEVNFGDESYPADAVIKAEFNFEILELAYEYAFLRGERYELSGSLGVHNVEFSLGLSADVNVSGDTYENSIDETAKAGVPLPVVGLRGTWRLGDSPLYLQAHAQYFEISYGDYHGNLQDYQAGILWKLSTHFGVGAAYNLFDTRVDADDDRFRGMLNWKYQGAQVFVRVGF